MTGGVKWMLTTGHFEWYILGAFYQLLIINKEFVKEVNKIIFDFL